MATARSPAEIPERGWRDVIRRSFRGLLAHETSLGAAGIAFYVIWAVFPALVASVVVIARLIGPERVLTLLGWLRGDLPKSFDAVVVGQLDAVARHSAAVSATTVLAAAALAIWAGMRGSRGLMTALNTVYGEREKRTFWQRAAVEFALACIGGLFLVASLGSIVLAAAAEKPSGAAALALVAPSRWPVLILGMLLLLAIAYRYGPCRPLAKWRWVTWGATVGAAIWVVGSFAFAYVAENIVHGNPLLGSLASVVMFLFWTYLTVIVILLGAHINAQLEQHTAVDTRAEKR